MKSSQKLTMVRHRPTAPTSPNATAAINRTEDITLGPPIHSPQPTSALKRKNKKMKKTLGSDTASSASSNNCSCATSFSQKGIKVFRNPKRIRVGSRRSVGPSAVDALGLPLGMSIAAFVAQVLERKNASEENMSVDYLSETCILAVRESLGNVFGDKFENFVTNFEKSFQSTLMTLRLISSSQHVDEQVQGPGLRCSCSVEKVSLSTYGLKKPIRLSESTEDLKSPPSRNITQQHQGVVVGTQPSLDGTKNSACLSCPRQSQTRSHTPENMKTDFSTGHELVVHEKKDEHQLICSTDSDFNQFSIMEKSIMEQTRSNDLKMFEIELTMKKLQLKEKQLELSSSSNLLERWKVSMGVSKAAFKAEKFKTHLQDSRQVELLKKCLDFLVAGLFIMLFSLGYGTYVYSHRRIIEITEACSPSMESKSSWWMPKSMSTFNSGLQLLNCQIQVLSRMLFGVLMIGAIALILIQRSSASHQTMPVTFILLLLGVGCGYAGKFCVDTLGGSGGHWLIYWEALCALHFFANTFHSSLYFILNGPITVVERGKNQVFFAYWARRLVFFATLLFIPLLCGLMPYAGAWEWCEHFQSRASDLLMFDNETVFE